MKDSIQNVEQVYNDEQIKNLSTHNAALQKRWQESQQQVASYAEKCRHQDRAIKSAQQELVRLQKTIQQLQTLRKNDEELNNLKHEMEAQKLAFEEEKIELNRQLHAERARCIEQEDAYLTLAKRLKHADLHYKPGFMDALQIRGVQVLFGILLGIVSALLYSLSNWSSTNSEVICPP
ncbi:uncharacterized protein BYT42DRAFT_336715 [Radiomyces spectabilis]|uniref:uncharacterized protein n=1 Tax=Radiomyces spectabilis TaxID=64574 RepID=UPI00221E6748|nr:uncharacterized protein BYT42DRAFT_336715 [Radiomyces spectabilis]KAI8379677.1 hypothetical protein BYT42DRAFT_336715 [Radiomyces spectabilis]